jgi:hypothetical protein
MGAENPIPNEHQRRLALFNEQAEILLGSRFAATMFGSVTGVTFLGRRAVRWRLG